MNSEEKNKMSESSKRRLVAIVIILLAQLLKNLDWEKLEFVDCTKPVMSEQSVDYVPIKHIKKRKQTELTFVSLKQYKGFENTSETEAEKQIDFIKRMAKVLYYMNIDEQKQTS